MCTKGILQLAPPKMLEKIPAAMINQTQKNWLTWAVIKPT